jgi:D-alanine-D-alanine ligase
MTKKINLGLLLGGRSCEHEVSVTSATSILKAINQDQYNVYLIGIDKSGFWHLGTDIDAITDEGSVTSLSSTPSPELMEVSMGLHNNANLTNACDADSEISLPELDAIFPVLHGTFGEDGTLQGVLEMAGIPYVGCGVAASSLAMDKALAKKVFEAAGLPQAPYFVARAFEWKSDPVAAMDAIESNLGLPVFVKPANLGSSVGVRKAKTRIELASAIDHAFEFDNKIVVEQSMENCHEVECAVLGNDSPKASILGEIVPGAEFYNYETKYIDDKTNTIIPAPLNERVTREVQELAIAAFQAIDGAGLARVDFFVDRSTMEITLNEVNTMPGFTPISMYPQLWAASGLPYPDLIDKLIELGIEVHQSKQSLKRAF